jgi:type II secretory pathway predicted ATPase ExeA
MKASQKIQDHFGFSRLPFTKRIAVNELFQSRSFKEAHTRLELALSEEDMVLITGGVGTGKSNVIRYFINRLDQHQFQPVYVPVDKTKIGDIAKSVLSDLNQKVPYTSSAAIRFLKQVVVSLNNDKGIKPVVVIDEAQALAPDLFLSLKNLVNYQVDSENYLLIILCGQLEIMDTLKLAELESVRRRLRLAYEIRAMSLEETSKYITHHLKLAGVDRQIFSYDTVSQIFQHSKGVPGQINKLCYDLIIYAVSDKKDIIEPSMLEKVA